MIRWQVDCASGASCTYRIKGGSLSRGRAKKSAIPGIFMSAVANCTEAALNESWTSSTSSYWLRPRLQTMSTELSEVGGPFGPGL
jgi:hypothetical protein